MVSPISTRSSVYELLEPVAPISWRIRDYLTRVPSHYGETSASTRAEIADHDKPLLEIVDVGQQLLASFPDQPSLTTPVVYSYDAEGNREDLSHLRRTSFFPGFTMPGASAEPESVSQAPRAAQSQETTN